MTEKELSRIRDKFIIDGDDLSRAGKKKEAVEKYKQAKVIQKEIKKKWYDE